MLRDLRIRSFALIDEITLAFETGFNVITGETGAGKTILMHALGLAVGGKAPNDVIRTGDDEATIEAVFALGGTVVGERIEEAGFEGGDELLVRRVVSRRGRNRVHLNAAPATVAVLDSLSDGLIRVYGQHEHHTLRQAETHLGLVDAFAAHPKFVATMAERWQVFHDLDVRLRRLTDGKEVARARAELLRFESDEIAGAGLRSGEDEELKQEKQILAAAEELIHASRQGEELLYAGEHAAAGALQKVARQIDELVEVDSRLGDIARLLSEAAVIVEEAGLELRDYAERIEADPERLAEVDERLVVIGKLRRKYGESIETILERKAVIDRELEDLDLGSDGLEKLEGDREKAETAALNAAKALRKSRYATADRLAKALAAELAELGMKGATIEARFSEGQLGPDGTDQVELFFSANPGEEPRALARVASGGELSRIMLALKTVALGDNEAPTLIFDEIDAGIGGAQAEVVGRKLAALAKDRQVICITHLAQIAAFADHHFAVAKNTVSGRTSSAARRLDEKERPDEVARMIGGVTPTAEARRHAVKLIELARALS